jgi:hypothetical protein
VQGLFALSGANSRDRIGFHHAYLTERPRAIPAAFPNDQLYRHTSVDPYISSPDLRRAVVRTTNHGIAVEITISPIARKKVNALASWNAKASKDGNFNARVGLALMVEGKPVRVIQGVHRLNANLLWLSLDSDGKALTQARFWASLINDANSP